MRMIKGKFSTYILIACFLPALLSVLIGSIFLFRWHESEWSRIQRNDLVGTASFFAALVDEYPLGLEEPSLARLAAT